MVKGVMDDNLFEEKSFLGVYSSGKQEKIDRDRG